MKKTKATNEKRSKGETPLQFSGDLAAWAAWLYYIEGETQEGAARKLGVSRATVANYINEAKARGLVDISIQPSLLATGQLSQQICETYGVKDVYVIPPIQAQEESSRDRVAIAGAKVLQSLLKDGDTLGVAWGRTMLDVGRVIPKAKTKDITVMQIAGSMLNEENSSPEFCTAMIANAFNARSLNFSAPSTVSTAQLKQQLIKEPILKRYFDRLEQCDVAIFGVGAFEEASEIGDHYIAQAEILDDYQQRGAVGILAGQFLDEAGNILDGPLSGRRIGISMETLRKVETRILVGAGGNKAKAIRAVLKGQLCTYLVTDIETAQQLIEDDAAAPKE